MRTFFMLLLLPMAVLAEGPEIKWGSWAVSSLAVIAAIFVLGWLLRRLRGAALLGGSRQLKIVASLAIGQRERVMVVQVGEEQWLLGVTAQQISGLGKLEQPLAMEPTKSLLAKLSPEQPAKDL
ncbi:flagellar biosynthetic protein FliO [Oceanisphaera sp. W20_SRM_FM3]|uniref:flagellar biosynthetic protein FliO n=1 Tax=Oceanisphaera sp. W20_SRM_FM3 TaxID=3240267 RepID=UPI003F99CA89